MSEVPSKDELKKDLRSRINKLDERIAELEELQEERTALEAALSALEGKGTPKTSQGRRKRGTQAELAERRNRVIELLEVEPDLSISDVAERLNIGYQTAANDLRILKANGSLPE